MPRHRALGVLLLILGALSLWLAWRGHRDGTIVVQFGVTEYRFERDVRPRVYAIALALHVIAGVVLCVVGALVLLGRLAPDSHA